MIILIKSLVKILLSPSDYAHFIKEEQQENKETLVNLIT